MCHSWTTVWYDQEILTRDSLHEVGICEIQFSQQQPLPAVRAVKAEENLSVRNPVEAPESANDIHANEQPS